MGFLGQSIRGEIVIQRRNPRSELLSGFSAAHVQGQIFLGQAEKILGKTELNRDSRDDIVVKDIGILTSQSEETLLNTLSIILRPQKHHTIGIGLLYVYGKVFE